MTVTLANPAPQSYIGLSTDAKPSTGLRVGATFLESDTRSVFVWDGAAFNPVYPGPQAVALLASASRTATQTSADLPNTFGLWFLDVILDVTVNTGGLGSVTVSVYAKDAASSKYYLLLAGAAVTGVTTNVYRIGPGLTAAANAVANLPVPKIFQIVVTANNANPMVYSVGYNLSGV